MKARPVLSMAAPFLLLAVLLTGCQTNRAFTDKHFQERVARIHTVGLIPEVHTGILNTYRGYDPSPGPFPNEPQIRSETIATARDQLEQRGFAVIEGTSSSSTGKVWSGRALQGFAPSVQTAKSNSTALATKLNVDGLIFLNVRAFKSTPHRKKITAPENGLATLEVMALIAGTAAGGPVSSGGTIFGVVWQDAALDISFVDGQTGEPLWATASDFDNFDKNKPTKCVEDLFSRYPKSKP